MPAAPSQDMDLNSVADQVLGELAHMTTEAALDNRRILPGDQ
jgi:hypothetical protein